MSKTVKTAPPTLTLTETFSINEAIEFVQETLTEMVEDPDDEKHDAAYEKSFRLLNSLRCLLIDRGMIAAESDNKDE